MRTFNIYIAEHGSRTTRVTRYPCLNQPPYNGEQALKAMRHFNRCGVDSMCMRATTEANGIFEILTLAEMVELFDEKWTPVHDDQTTEPSA